MHSPIERNVLQHKINTKTTAGFSHPLRHPAWKWRGPNLILAFHKFDTYLFRHLPIYLQPWNHMEQPIQVKFVATRMNLATSYNILQQPALSSKHIQINFNSVQLQDHLCCQTKLNRASQNWVSFAKTVHIASSIQFTSFQAERCEQALSE